MEQLKRDSARSTSYRSRFLHHLSVSLFAGVVLLTISAFFGYPMAFTTGASSCCERHGIRSEEHTSELQSRFDLVCRLLLEKKKLAQIKRLALGLEDDRPDTHDPHREYGAL